MVVIAAYLGFALILMAVCMWLQPDVLTPDVAQWEHNLFIADEEHKLHVQDLFQRVKVAVAIRTVERSGRMVTLSEVPHMPQPDRLAWLTLRATLAARTPQIQRAIARAKAVTSVRHAATTR